MSVSSNKEEARIRVEEIVSSFKNNEAAYIASNSKYNETQTRTDYITPLLEALGWDVYNKASKPLDLREVYEEATVEVGEEKLSKKPDYEVRIVRERKFFVEAKKPSVNIEQDIAAAFQVRRYGFSASLPMSVLTNFRQLAIYDCSHVPSQDDQAHVARLGLYSCDDFVEKFDEIYERISKEAVYSGSFDQIYLVDDPEHETNQFDRHFFSQISDWRIRLARDIHLKNNGFSPEELTYIVQLFISRIVFLRICEDRDIENYQNLKSVGEERTFESLMVLLEKADNFYDSGLFDLLFDRQIKLNIGDEVLFEIIDELYYPQSPYTFAVVEAGVLGEIYERFLGEVLKIGADGQVETIEKPEVRESGGVVPTPQYIVSDILDRALLPELRGKTPQELESFTVIDICCGSGVFLIGALDVLLNYHLEWYLESGTSNSLKRVYEVGSDQWRLTFEEKRRILLQTIRGVDIDSNAVEIAKFSLLLKLIENETSESLNAFAAARNGKVLPKLEGIILCGNSLIESNLIGASNLGAKARSRINPFDWSEEYSAEISSGGFNVIVGNPPYIRIQNMVTYSPEEVELYRSEAAMYSTAQSGSFDKYTLFVERSLELASHSGVVGIIIPNKFMTTTTGSALRKLITENKYLSQVVHFGSQQVFGSDATNYTCTLILSKTQNDAFSYERVSNLREWRYSQTQDFTSISCDGINENPWSFNSEAVNALFEKIDRSKAFVLGGKDGIAEIFVGVQTSNDNIYIFSPKKVEPDHVIFEKDNKEWRIEMEVLRPCLHDVVLEAYKKPEANKYMLFPYRITDGVAQLIQPDEMAQKFPGAWSYLNANKVDLEKRNIVGGNKEHKQWYQFGRSQSLTKFQGSKIILPILSREPKYCFDDEDIVVTGGGNGPYYLISPRSGSNSDLYFILSVLCHPVSEALIRSLTSVFRGGYYSHGKQYIENLPLPSSTEEQKEEIASLVSQLIQVSESIDTVVLPHQRVVLSRNFSQLKANIENKITDLYGLTDLEMDLIRGVPIPE